MNGWFQMPLATRERMIVALAIRDIVNTRVLDQPSIKWLQFSPPIHYRTISFNRVEQNGPEEAHLAFMALDHEMNGISGKIPLTLFGDIGNVAISQLFHTSSDINEVSLHDLKNTELINLEEGQFISVRSLLFISSEIDSCRALWERTHPRRLNTFQMITDRRQMLNMNSIGGTRIENIRRWNLNSPHDPSLLVLLIDKWISLNVPIGYYGQFSTQFYQSGIMAMLHRQFRTRLLDHGQLIRHEHGSFNRHLSLLVNYQKKIIIGTCQPEPINVENDDIVDPFIYFVARMVPNTTSHEEYERLLQLDGDLQLPSDYFF